MMSRVLSLAAARALVATSSTVVTHDQGGKDRVDFRQGAYRTMGWHMGLPVEESRLLPKAWSNMDDFRDKGAALKQAIDTLADTAGGDDVTATRNAIGGACKACHDAYREYMTH